MQWVWSLTGHNSARAPGNHEDEIRKRLWALLGHLPPLFVPQARLISRIYHNTYTLEHLMFENGLGTAVYAYVLIPLQAVFPAPAVLYHHVHGGKYALGKDMILQEQADGRVDGVALAQAGFIVMAIDAYAFGERQQQGPAGERERGHETEHALFKHFLWQGRTLWGMMLHDDLLALAYLRRRPEVDTRRIGATGMSLGGSRTTWLAALDEAQGEARLKVIIPIAQLTRYADFAASGNYHLHSFYYYVPGALRAGLDMEHIVGLAAPRYQRVLIGDSDPLSPLSGVQTIIQHVQGVYAAQGAAAQFEPIIYPGTGHEYTAAMRQDMLAGFRLHL